MFILTGQSWEEVRYSCKIPMPLLTHRYEELPMRLVDYVRELAIRLLRYYRQSQLQLHIPNTMRESEAVNVLCLQNTWRLLFRKKLPE